MEPDDDKTRSHITLTKGVMVGHYRIVEKIGAGGMGEVYLAEDTKLNRQVALKFLPEYLASDQDAKSRFTREARAGAALKHPNIVTIFEVSEFGGRPYFAMECCEGESLRDLIKEQAFSLNKSISLAIQLGDALQEAHEAGIIHRDIKPSNIIMDKKGRPKLADFGLAAVRGTDKITRTGSTLGTIGYMSPEQIKVADLDHRSDLFSFGVVLYEMIAGRPPFAGDSEAATLNAVLNDIPEPLSRYKAGITDELQRIVSKLLEKDPELRYQSAADVVADLKRLVTSEAAAIKKPVDWWNRYVVIGAVIVLVVITALWFLDKLKIFNDTGGGQEKKKMLVVLPFENLGDPDEEYFADGITDEITSKLGIVKGLGVISRTSAIQYKHTDKGLPQIAKELGVDYVLEGTIRWDKSGDTDLVRITPQLIKASDNTHVWAGNYQQPLRSVFAVQAEIATRIVSALDMTLLQSEQQMMNRAPTENLQAYEYYLRAVDAFEQDSDARQAIQILDQAIKADGNFCRAHALMAQMRGYAFINSLDRSKENIENARRAADRAYELAAGEPDGYLARGYFDYYFGYDYDRALDNFEKALHDQPNNSELLAAIGYVKRRQGKWDEAVTLLSRAVELNPFSISIVNGLGTTYFGMHRLKASMQVADDALKLMPDDPNMLTTKALIMFLLQGDSPAFREMVEKVGRLVSQSISGTFMELVDIFLRDYESALQCRPSAEYFDDTTDYYISRAEIYHLMGRDSIGRIYDDSAYAICEALVKTRPDEAIAYLNLSSALAGLGRKDEALRAADHAVDLIPLSKDALLGSQVLATRAYIYCMVGEYDPAIDQLDTLLRIPSTIQVEILRIDPAWDPVRDDPRFQALLDKYGNR